VTRFKNQNGYCEVYEGCTFYGSIVLEKEFESLVDLKAPCKPRYTDPLGKVRENGAPDEAGGKWT
jgi:hypothetical protein